MKKLLVAAAITGVLSASALYAEAPQVSQDAVMMDAAASTNDEIVPLILIGLLLMAALSATHGEKGYLIESFE